VRVGGEAAAASKQQCVTAVFVLVVRCVGASDKVRVSNARRNRQKNNNKLLPSQLGKVAATKGRSASLMFGRSYKLRLRHNVYLHQHGIAVSSFSIQQ
jgi:hypothetical protein